MATYKIKEVKVEDTIVRYSETLPLGGSNF